MSPILFITFMDRISRHSQGVEGVQFGDLRIRSLLFADDMVLFTSSVRDLQLFLDRLAAKCEEAGMKISTTKSEAMVLSPKKGGVPFTGRGDSAPSRGLQIPWGLVHE